MSAKIYIEGGGDSKNLKIECQKGFKKLLTKCGFDGRMPRLVACGGRGKTYDKFKIAFKSGITSDYIALLVDSEDPIDNIENAWKHLKSRDKWLKPRGASDDQVLLMTTCMETWIVADRETLKEHYRGEFQESALPPLIDLENRHRHEILKQLKKASHDSYDKGKHSFEILGKLNPETLSQHLPSFDRVQKILKKKLK